MWKGQGRREVKREEERAGGGQVGGTMLRGSLTLRDRVLIGPDRQGRFVPVQVKPFPATLKPRSPCLAQPSLPFGAPFS